MYPPVEYRLRQDPPFGAIKEFGSEEVVVDKFCLNTNLIVTDPLFDVFSHTCVVIFVSCFLYHLCNSWITQVMTVQGLMKFI